MRNLLFVIFLLSMYSCSKDIPIEPVNEYDPYYPNKPIKIWNTHYDNGSIIGSLNFVEDKIVFIHNYDAIIAFNKNDGTLAWEADISDFEAGLDFTDIDAKLIGGQLYIIDKNYPRFLVIDFSTGEVLDYRSLASSGRELSRSFGFQYLGNHIYFARYDIAGFHEFYKYDFVNDTGEVLIDMSEYDIEYSGRKSSVISEDERNIYLGMEVEESGQSRIVIIKIDLAQKSLEEIWEAPASSNSRGLGYYVLIDNMIVIEAGNLFGVDVTTGQTVWSHNIRENSWTYALFDHQGQVYRITNNLFCFDFETGALIYESDKFGLNGRDCYSTVPYENLILGVSYKEFGEIDIGGGFTFPKITQVCTIYDLTDGQRLVEWNPSRVPGEELDDVGVRAITSDPETRDIYVSTGRQLIKYEWPL